jgi:hypothetical protein
MSDLYYKPGDNYFCCPVCGFKTRVSDGRKRWDGEFVCRDDYEIRHPQELNRYPFRDRIAARISRPEPTAVYIDPTDVTSGDL